MLNRCFNENNHSYKNYGARGITVCARWKDFANFLADMGPKPVGKSLDRINNDGNYEPSNCHWATPIQQGNNTRANRHVEVQGEKLTIAQCARRFGLTPMTIKYRLRRGDSDLTRPALKDSAPKFYTYAEQSLKLSEWARKVGIRKGLLELRLSRGWTFSRAIETPLQRKRG